MNLNRLFSDEVAVNRAKLRQARERLAVATANANGDSTDPLYLMANSTVIFAEEKLRWWQRIGV